jgi:hypothetical protein
MRFFRANQTHRSPEDEAAAARLMAIAIRGKVERSPHLDPQDSPQSADEAQAGSTQ